MKYIKWGVLGCSVSTLPIIRLLGSIEGAQVVAVMNEQREDAKSFASELDCKYYTDVQELIDDSDVNAVFVASASSTHATYAVLSMRRGKPVLLNAPLANTYWDCVRINRVSEETGVSCFVNYFMRYLPYFESVDKYLKSGALGTLLSVELRSVGIPPHFLKADMSMEEVFWTMGAHQIDLLQHLFGVIIEAWGIGMKEKGQAVSSCFKFETGLAGSALWTLSAPKELMENEVIVIGEQGQLRFSLFGDNPIRVKIGSDDELVEQNGECVNLQEDVCLPLLKEVVSDLQGFNVCTCTSISGTPVHWVLDRFKELDH